jgi:hypothetical protein
VGLGFALDKAGALLLEPHLQPVLLWLFWGWSLMNYFPIWPGTQSSQCQSSKVTRITNVSHRVGAGGEMTQALDARMNNKTIRKKKKKKQMWAIEYLICGNIHGKMHRSANLKFEHVLNVNRPQTNKQTKSCRKHYFLGPGNKPTCLSMSLHFKLNQLYMQSHHQQGLLIPNVCTWKIYPLCSLQQKRSQE